MRMDVGEIWWVRCAMDSSGSGLGPLVGSYEHGNESSVSIKGKRFLDQLSDY
jgi:hypothetical protein